MQQPIQADSTQANQVYYQNQQPYGYQPVNSPQPQLQQQQVPFNNQQVHIDAQNQQPYGYQPINSPQPQLQQQQAPFNNQQIYIDVQNPVGFAPVFMPQPIFDIGDALDLLQSLPSVYIRQRQEWIEAVCDIETPSTFYVYKGDQQGDIVGDRPILRAKEHSKCCARNFLGTGCRPFKLNVQQYTGNLTKTNKNEYKEDKKLIFETQRPYAWTCFCLNRPILTVYNRQFGQQTILGTLRAPFYCCNFGIQVHGKDGELVYIIEASCCQAIFWIPCPCKACQVAKFIIYNPQREPLVELWKESQGCWAASATDNGDNYRVLFPPGATKEQKALLVIAAIYLDYRFFEDYSNKNEHADIFDLLNILT